MSTPKSGELVLYQTAHGRTAIQRRAALGLPLPTPAKPAKLAAL
ncbi:MAG TPA: hypothetical protein PLT25_11825 [Acidocella sp.]|nr:hypothetical protein [Acidocella sp.]HQU05390.1 hypothetical protein [Acidocella sp.]